MGRECTAELLVEFHIVALQRLVPGELWDAMIGKRGLTTFESKVAYLREVSRDHRELEMARGTPPGYLSINDTWTGRTSGGLRVGGERGRKRGF